MTTTTTTTTTTTALAEVKAQAQLIEANYAAGMCGTDDKQLQALVDLGDHATTIIAMADKLITRATPLSVKFAQLPAAERPVMAQRLIALEEMTASALRLMLEPTTSPEALEASLKNLDTAAAAALG